MPEPQLFRRQLLSFPARHRNRRRDRRAKHPDRRRAHFDLARAHLAVASGGVAEHHRPLDLHHALHTDGSRRGNRLGARPIGTERELHEAIAVAQINEHNAPQIPRTVHPATEPNRRPDVRGTEGTREVCTERSSEIGHNEFSRQDEPAGIGRNRRAFVPANERRPRITRSRTVG